MYLSSNIVFVSKESIVLDQSAWLLKEIRTQSGFFIVSLFNLRNSA